MNVIFLSRKHGRPLTLQLNPRLLISGVVGLVFLSLGIGQLVIGQQLLI